MTRGVPWVSLGSRSYPGAIGHNPDHADRYSERIVFTLDTSLEASPPAAGPSPAAPRYRQLSIRIVLLATGAGVWALSHRYGGLTKDAHLYAMQALSRIFP